MDRSELSDIAHAHHPVAAPVSPAKVATLVERLVLPEGGRAVDLGCGHGVWLTELLAAHPTATGVGLDLDLPADVVTAAWERGVGDRVHWEQGDAAGWAGGVFDVVLCVGASHAFGGLDGTLAAVRRHLRPGGQVLLGDGIWEGPPSAAALEAVGDWPGGLTDLIGLLDRARVHGFEPGYGHVSSLAEWDDYEFSWTGSLVAWALQDARTVEDREQALATAREHRDMWVRGWRRELGFATVLLHDLGTAETGRP
ncbi:class I SAM-dependent methyltransferase [Modestobacter sp. L9-4]|uniref:SAM-dependent methyltransferase n=1 Tax=Modestobacter sp. L9-4 TaxID=2851567 RepID=UPI001C753DCE|nr:class I SAM-dependent methyltransferase [Modestobacter sp. L9-4]QXG76135.1 class I SAM-dependent methyltransferase [Modestobacter sp. L9-4]